jgi:hypothetical protein
MSTIGQFSTVSPSGSDSHARVPAGTDPKLLLSASLDARAHASVYNHSAGSLYLRFGLNTGLQVSGSAVSFDVKVTSGSLYELPKPVWQGEVWGMWDVPANSWVMVLELGKATS